MSPVKNILCYMILNLNLFLFSLSQSCNQETKSCSSSQSINEDFQTMDLPFITPEVSQSLENKPANNNTTTDDYLNITYRNLFVKKGDENEKYLSSFENESNYTDYYDFTLENEEVKAINIDRMNLYPSKKFLNTNQGNFLHFLKVAYEKQLPVYFTTEIFMEGMTKTFNRMKKIFFEDILIHYIKRFAENMVNFISNNKDKPKYKSIRFSLDSVQVYYSLISYLITNKIEEFTPRIDIEAEFNRWKKIVESYSVSEIFFMGKKKKVNYQYLSPVGYWKTSQRLNNIWQATGFLTVHRFHIVEDIKGIWTMGRLVDDAGLGDHFNRLSEMLTYLKGQNAILLNVVEIARLGVKEGFSDYLLTSEEFSKLSELASANRHKLSLAVLDQMLLWSKEQVELMKEIREKHTHFLSADLSVIDWIINKVTDYREKSPRTIVSYYEINEIITGNKYARPVINSRMKGVKRTAYERVMKLRDFKNYTDHLDASETVLERSMEVEIDGWRDNIQNHFHLLTRNANAQYISKDPLYKSNIFKQKNFNFGPAFLTELNMDHKVMSRYMAYKTTEGKIPELWLEPNIKFYDEVNVLLSRFEYNLNNFLNYAEEALKVNFRYVRTRYGRALEDLKYANNLLRRGIELQESKRMNDELKSELSQVLYVEEISDTWDGWLARLYDTDSQMSLFTFDSYASFIQQADANEKEGFLGANLFTYNKFNEIGICIVKDYQNDQDKLMLFSIPNFSEAYLKVDDLSFNTIKEIITQRLGY